MLRDAPLIVSVTTTVTVYVFGGVPAVCPTTPGLLDPPAQPAANAARNKPAVTVIQARRRRRAARKNTIIAASSKRLCVIARSGAKLRGESHGIGRAVERDGAVVVTVVVTVIGALSVNELGDDEQVPAGIALMHETVTGSLNPPAGERDSGNVADCPALTVAEVEPPGGTEIIMSVPWPDRVMACGLPGALSKIVIAPARAPVAEGVKVTLMMQVPPPAATVALFAHVVPAAVAKSPLAAMLAIFNVALPVLVSVTFCTPLVELSS